MNLMPIAKTVALSAELSRRVASTPTPCKKLGSSGSIGFQSYDRASGHITSQDISRHRVHGNANLPDKTAQAIGSQAIGSQIVSQKAVFQTRSQRAQRAGDWKFFDAPVNQNLKVDEVVEKLDSGQLWVVNSRRRNGLIVMREFHAEFAGPGAAVGGDLDHGDIVKIIPIGNLSLLKPDSHEAHQNAIKIRLQWIRLTQNFTDQPSPDDRARMILEQFKTYFDQTTVNRVPDKAFAMLVGVLPQTIHRVRSGFAW